MILLVVRFGGQSKLETSSSKRKEREMSNRHRMRRKKNWATEARVKGNQKKIGKNAMNGHSQEERRKMKEKRREGKWRMRWKKKEGATEDEREREGTKKMITDESSDKLDKIGRSSSIIVCPPLAKCSQIKKNRLFFHRSINSTQITISSSHCYFFLTRNRMGQHKIGTHFNIKQHPNKVDSHSISGMWKIVTVIHVTVTACHWGICIQKNVYQSFVCTLQQLYIYLFEWLFVNSV